MKTHDLPRFDKKDRKGIAKYFRENGCVVIKNMYPKGAAEELKEEIHRLISQQVKKHIPKQKYLPANGFDKGLIELSKHNDDLRRRIYDLTFWLPKMISLVDKGAYYDIAKVLGVKFPLMTPPGVRMDLPGDNRFLWPPHQDNKGTRSPTLLIMASALVDLPVERGALKLAVGSHKLGSLRPVDDPKYRYQTLDPESYKGYELLPAPLKAGETLIFHTYMIHQSAGNDSAATRWQVMVRFEDGANMPFLDGDDTFQEFNIKG